MARRDTFGLAKQAALGTKQTVMEHFPPVDKATVKDSTDKFSSEETTGSRAPVASEKGAKLYEVTASGTVRPASFPKIASAFAAATKTQPDAGGAPTAYSYLFDFADPDPAWMSVLATMKDPKPDPIVALLWDAIGSSLTLTAQPNGYLEWEAQLDALDLEDAGAAPVATLDATKRFVFDQVKVYASVNGGAETEIKVNSWSVAIETGLDTDTAILGSRKRDGADFGDLAASVSFGAKESLPEWFWRAVADDPDSVKVRMAATGAVIGGAVAYKVEVIAYNVQVDEAPAGIDAKSRLNVVPVKGSAYLDATGKFVTLEIVNETDNAA